MVSLIEAARAPDFPAEIVLVLSNRPDAAGLARAAEAGIAVKAVDHKAYPDRDSFDAALDAELRAAGIELVCLAGFMRIFTPGFVEGWAGRMLNIHPSLLPLFKGTHTHERALEAGVRLHGCTVHYVVPELDAGPIVAQAAAREIAFQLGLNIKQVSAAVKTIMNAYRAFRDCDGTMLEINPLVVTKDDRVLALDAKMSFDDNAMFRRRNIADMHDPSQSDPREAQAAEHNLNYIGLEGEIGCIVNGAGLAMATMDMIKHAGGEPANFLDVGGGASPERVATAFRLVLSDKNVKAILVNIFAGINRCDWIAEGVVKAAREVEITVPLIVRLAGTNVEAGKQILAESGLDLITADTLSEAAAKAVDACNTAKNAHKNS